MTGRDLERNPDVVVRDMELLCTGWRVLSRTTFHYRRADGSWSTQQGETYNHGDGGGAALRRRARHRAADPAVPLAGVLDGHPDGLLVEAAAGLLDDDDPVAAIKREAAEELSVELRVVELVMAPWMSLGSVIERLHLFAGAYSAADRAQLCTLSRSTRTSAHGLAGDTRRRRMCAKGQPETACCTIKSRPNRAFERYQQYPRVDVGCGQATSPHPRARSTFDQDATTTRTSWPVLLVAGPSTSSLFGPTMRTPAGTFA